MRTISQKVLLRHNRNLSQAEFQIARDVCERINQLVRDRDVYVSENHVDPQFCYPGGMWSSTAYNDYLNTFSEVSACSFEVINRLRLFMSFFSGYSLRRASCTPGPPSFETVSSSLDLQIDELMKIPDEWVSRWTALTAWVPTDLIFSPPKFLGEIGWDVSGVVVNHDTCVYQERINLIYQAGIFDWLSDCLSAKGRLRILEIGAGYGALAYKIKNLFPASDYWICDLPESLLFSALYLSLTRPDCKAAVGEEAPYGFTYIPNYMIHTVTGKFDLVINTLSFSEMTEYQVRTYAQKISGLLDDGVLFEQNQDNRGIGLPYAGEILREYFNYNRSMTTEASWRITQGCGNLWANRPINLWPCMTKKKQRYAWNIMVRAYWLTHWLRRGLSKAILRMQHVFSVRPCPIIEFAALP